jgi:hypothetical protein
VFTELAAHRAGMHRQSFRLICSRLICIIWHVHPLKAKNPESLALNRVSRALAVFIMRPQAVPQIGAGCKLPFDFSYCQLGHDVKYPRQ